MKIETLYNFGDKIYYALGEQMAGIITGVTISPAGKDAFCVRYEVSMEEGEARWCYEFELITERTFKNEED